MNKLRHGSSFAHALDIVIRETGDGSKEVL
jgi:hypothetical protein